MVAHAEPLVLRFDDELRIVSRTGPGFRMQAPRAVADPDSHVLGG